MTHYETVRSVGHFSGSNVKAGIGTIWGTQTKARTISGI